jgi:hypothetical protein
MNISINRDENIKEPIAPEIVFLGLIFVNLGPLKIFPNINPPISDATQVSKTTKIKIFKCKKDERIKKYVQKEKM